MKYDCVIWDWNGTLIDDMGVSLGSVNRILADRGMPPITEADYYDYIDTPITRFYERLFDLEKTDVTQLLREFNVNYDALLDGGEVREGTRLALKAAADAGVRQIVLSAFEQNKLRRMLREYGVDGCFAAVLGADNIHCGDKTDRAREYFAAEGLSPERAVVIGDTLHDAAVAKAVGCACVLVRGGHQGDRELEASGVQLADSAADAVKLALGIEF
ncbi:MAG: HAD family hydrolase [Clostridia bacterium]|nr:HAD family hydrolase [Clostridia bacterium]